MQRYVPLSIRLSATRAVGLWEKIIIMIILVNIEIMIIQMIIFEFENMMLVLTEL